MALDGHEDPSAGAPAYTTTTGQGLGDHTSSGVRPMNENENLPSLDKTADSTEGLDTLAASDSCGYDKKLDGLEGQDDGPPMAQLGFSEPAVVGSDAASPPVFLSGMKLALVFAALMVSVFLVNLDQTIVATALPHIVSQFDALPKATWVATAYFLTDAGFMLSIGQLLTSISVKVVYVASILVFEVGSVICGAASSINMLIFGRAIAGCGSAGITICSIATIAQFTALEQRPMLFALFGVDLAVASIVGPLLGGAFTDHLTWRWCFYINLPFGGVGALAILLWLPYHRNNFSSMKASKGWINMVTWRLDWIGTVLILCVATCALLALQWGGTMYKWNSGVIIGLLCTFVALLGIFIAWEHALGSRALLPFQILKRRTQYGACLEASWLLMAMITAIYYLPLWYQINGRTPIQSGIDILPFMLSFVVGSTLSATLTFITGRYWHVLVTTPLLGCVGAGLLFSVDAQTSSARLLGYQIILGLGIGMSFQTTYVSVQAEWAEEQEKTTQASGVLTFISFFGGILGIGIAGTVFNNQLSKELASRLPNLDPAIAAAVKESVTVIETLPASIKQSVIDAAIKANTFCFLVTLVACALASVSGLFIKNYSMKERATISGGGH